MVLTDILLKHQIEDMAYESVGFSGADLNSTNGTAVETITKCSIVSPDILNVPEIVSRYGVLVDFAKQAAFLILVIWLIGYLIQMIDIDQYSKYASTLPFMKRGLIGLFMIGSGLFVYKMLMDFALELSILFGGSDSLIQCISGPFIGDLGALMTGLSCLMLVFMGLFYLCRYILLIIGLGLWVIGWLFWIAGSGDSAFHYKLESFGLFLLQFVIVNIFIGAAMCFVFWMGVLISEVGTSYGNIGSWGGYMIGLCFVFLSGFVPIIAFWWLIQHPRYVVHRITGGVI